jgi:hypothetical protein
MENNKPLKNEGVFSMADRFVADFFEQLKKGAADQIIRKAENAKIPKKVIDNMKRIKDDTDEMVKMIKNL